MRTVLIALVVGAIVGLIHARTTSRKSVFLWWGTTGLGIGFAVSVFGSLGFPLAETVQKVQPLIAYPASHLPDADPDTLEETKDIYVHVFLTTQSRPRYRYRLNDELKTHVHLTAPAESVKIREEERDTAVHQTVCTRYVSRFFRPDKNWTLGWLLFNPESCRQEFVVPVGAWRRVEVLN